MNERTKPVCPNCKGDNVVADANAEWDVEAQLWVLRQEFDELYCCDCDQDITPEWVAVKAEECRLVSHAPQEQRQTSLPARVGKPWTEPEDMQLMSLFQAGQPVAEIAQVHRRTQAGIQARLEHLGLAPANVELAVKRQAFGTRNLRELVEHVNGEPPA